MMYIPVHYQHPESRTFRQYQAAELYFISYNRNNQSPFQAVFLPRISRRYGNIIEYTEPIGSTAHTVMSWRPGWELEMCLKKRSYTHLFSLIVFWLGRTQIKPICGKQAF